MKFGEVMFVTSAGSKILSADQIDSTLEDAIWMCTRCSKFYNILDLEDNINNKKKLIDHITDDGTIVLDHYYTELGFLYFYRMGGKILSYGFLKRRSQEDIDMFKGYITKYYWVEIDKSIRIK